MSANKKPPEGSSAGRDLKGDVYRATLHAKSQEEIAKLLRKMTLDVGSIKVHRDTKEVDVLLFVTQEQAEQIKKEGWKLEVFENLTAIGRERQKEVGKGDRFERGKIAPKGLGKKTRKEG